ncbi:transglycosylase SLT domain-containing protein, partial [bacterium]|nr:transglycosylase SLT domain-containing protein [bacterium]
MRINFKLHILVLFVALALITKAQAYCFEEAGQRYSVSPLLLYVISSVESAFDTLAVNVNTNGSEDRGHM